MDNEDVNRLAKIRACIIAQSLEATEHQLYVSICKQKLFHFEKEQLLRIYDISSSKNKASCIAESYGTPLGLHKVDEKHGGGEKIGMVFQSREPIGKTYQDYLADPLVKEKDCITTRILWLAGLEPGINQGYTKDGQLCDTKERYIYFHGTPYEDEIERKEALSRGCIRMKNKDILELYEKIPLGTQVYIDSN